EDAVNPRQKGGVSTVHRMQPVTLATRYKALPEFPEVIVPPDERAALLRYEEFLRREPAVSVQMASVRTIDSPHGIEPLEITALEFGDLGILPLARSEPEGDTR